jgi:hypothetical protein
MFQASGTEGMDVKDSGGTSMVPQNISEYLPDDIFEDDTKPLISSGNHSSPAKLEQKSAVLSVPVKDESNKISLDSSIKCEEGDDLGLTVAEDDTQKSSVSGVPVKDELNEFSFDSSIKCEEGDDLSLTLAEDDMQKSSVSGVPVKDELNEFSFDSSIKCEEGDDLGLTLTEDDMANASVETAVSDIKVDLDDDCIDVETVSEQIPGECSGLIFTPATNLTNNVHTLAACCLLTCCFAALYTVMHLFETDITFDLCDSFY